MDGQINTFAAPFHPATLSLMVFDNQFGAVAILRFGWNPRAFVHCSNAVFTNHNSAAQFTTPLLVVSEAEVSILAVNSYQN